MKRRRTAPIPQPPRMPAFIDRGHDIPDPAYGYRAVQHLGQGPALIGV